MARGSKRRPCLGGGGGVARLNLRMSCVGVYQCFTLLSEIERKSFVVIIIEKVDSSAL